MQLIMKTEFDNIRLNDNYEYDSNKNSEVEVVKIYHNGNLICKKRIKNRKVSYYGIKNYKDYMT